VANHPSALKRERQARKQRERNRTVTSKMKTAVKKARLSLTQDNPEQRTARIREATSVIDRAASKGVIPKKRASRKISRMTIQMNKTVSAT
jgi:small subunit ribosomal protein S20